MDVFKFELQGYLGSIRGINGRIIPVDDSNANNNNENNDELPIAQSCVLELVHKDTLKLCRKTIMKEELDGFLLQEIPHLVKSIQNALDDTCAKDIKVSACIREEKLGNLALILSFPCVVGLRSTKFSLEEVAQDKMSILTQRVDLLTRPVTQMEQNKRIWQDSKFVASGPNLNISKCGKMIMNKGKDAWVTAVMGKTMLRGKHFVELMTLRMSTRYEMMCGVVLPDSDSELNEHIGKIQEGCRLYLFDGTVRKFGDSSKTTVGLPGCNGSNGVTIVSVFLDLDDNKIQFSLNGMESDVLDISPGEYAFAVTLFRQWDSVKLLSYKQT